MEGGGLNTASALNCPIVLVPAVPGALVFPERLAPCQPRDKC